MYTQVATTPDIALQEGIIGCIITAIYANGYSSPDVYDQIIETVAGRELFLDIDIIKLIKTQLTFKYVLEEDVFLRTCCEKITPEWRQPVFTIACHLILDSRVTLKAVSFLKTLKEELQLKNVREIIEVIQCLHKNKHRYELNII